MTTAIVMFLVFLVAFILSWLITRRIVARWKRNWEPTEQFLAGVCVFGVVFFVLGGLSIGAMSVYRQFTHEVVSAVAETADAIENVKERALSEEDELDDSSPAETQMKGLQDKIVKWQTSRDKLKELLGQLKRDKTSVLEKLDQLGISSDDFASDPKAQILSDELKEILRQTVICERKHEDYDLAVLKSETRVRTLARRLEADAGVGDSEIAELTQSIEDLDRSLMKEGEGMSSYELERALAGELSRFRQEQQPSSPAPTEKVEYGSRSEVMNEAAAIRTAVRPLQLVHVSEIAGPWAFCLSEDGLTIYYEQREKREATIYAAHRKDAESLFEDKAALSPGFFPNITGDGLEMMMLVITAPPKIADFFSTTRNNVEGAFRRPTIVTELHDPKAFAFPKNPYLSSDGLTLYFNRYPEENKVEMVFATRLNRESQWSKPRQLKIQEGDSFGKLVCPFVTEDGLTLLCTVETPEIWATRSNLLKFTRSRPEAPFSHPEFINIEGIPKLMVRWPHYVSATKELFLVQYEEERFQKGRLVIVKDYVP